jgi:hypothetical protein
MFNDDLSLDFDSNIVSFKISQILMSYFFYFIFKSQSSRGTNNANTTIIEEVNEEKGDECTTPKPSTSKQAVVTLSKSSKVS